MVIPKNIILIKFDLFLKLVVDNNFNFFYLYL